MTPIKLQIGDNMNDIRDTILSLTKNVTKTSGEIFKTTKLSLSLSAEESNLKNIHLEIGRKVHEIYQYGGNLGKFFDEKYLEIEACERRIAETKEQISQIKGTRECIKCGKTVERTAEFCPKCGTRIEADAIEPVSEPVSQAPTPNPPPIPETTRTCRICSAENETSAKFCLSCGRILE